MRQRRCEVTGITENREPAVVGRLPHAARCRVGGHFRCSTRQMMFTIYRLATRDKGGKPGSASCKHSSVVTLLHPCSHLYKGCDVGLSSAEVQVSPPSALTSTRTTARPPPATAYPLIVTSSSYWDTEDPSAGDRIAEFIGNCWIAGDCDCGGCAMAAACARGRYICGGGWFCLGAFHACATFACATTLRV